MRRVGAIGKLNFSLRSIAQHTSRNIWNLWTLNKSLFLMNFWCVESHQVYVFENFSKCTYGLTGKCIRTFFCWYWTEEDTQIVGCRKLNCCNFLKLFSFKQNQTKWLTGNGHSFVQVQLLNTTTQTNFVETYFPGRLPVPPGLEEQQRKKKDL